MSREGVGIKMSTFDNSRRFPPKCEFIETNSENELNLIIYISLNEYCCSLLLLFRNKFSIDHFQLFINNGKHSTNLV